jgi:ABC-type multidrug transport system fused ATPase/permease subunit
MTFDRSFPAIASDLSSIHWLFAVAKTQKTAYEALYDCLSRPSPPERTLIMALYSIHLRGSGSQALADAAFVRQAFNWQAFFFGPAWLIWQQLWAALLLWAGTYLVLLAASGSIISADATVFIALLFQIFLGLEASRLREAKLAAQGYHLVEILAAPDRDQAMVAFYQQHEPSEAITADIESRPQGGVRL